MRLLLFGTMREWIGMLVGRKVELELHQPMAKAIDHQETAVHQKDRELLKVVAKVLLVGEGLDRNAHQIADAFGSLEAAGKIIVLRQRQSRTRTPTTIESGIIMMNYCCQHNTYSNTHTFVHRSYTLGEVARAFLALGDVAASLPLGWISSW
jgi:hypothetical protein